MSDTKVVKIGEVGVDSGQLMLCDPCYIESEWQEGGGIGSFSYEGCCNRTLATDGNGNPEYAGQLNYRMGHAGAGVVTSTGFGDGCYPVMAEIRDVPGWGQRVVKIWVNFMDEEEVEHA